MQRIILKCALVGCIASVIIGSSSFCHANHHFGPPHSWIIRGGSTSYPNETTDNFYAQFLSRNIDEEEEDRYPLSKSGRYDGRPQPKSLRRSISSMDRLVNKDIYDVTYASSSSYDPFSTIKDPYDDFSEEMDSDDNYQSMDNFDALQNQNSGENTNSPVVYQYYGRSRARGNPSNPVHFILLGPNVDHWKVTGQLLASRGFNAMACERLDKENDRSKDAPNLVMDILQVMKWKRVVLVGCDKEALLAMQTAIMLSGEEVAGLVLCGDMTEANAHASASGFDVLDSFLKQTLDCPFVIIWDGDSPSLIHGSSAHESLESGDSATDRCLILGGGSAPHRTKPEQFTWILTRFVEEKLELPKRRPRIRNINNDWNNRSKSMGFLQALNVPFGINSLVSPEGRLLLGRAAAAALFYITMMRVIVVQYGILRAGLITVKTKYDSVATFRAKMFQAIGAFFLNYGYIPRLFKIRNEDAKRKDTDDVVKDSKDTQKKKENKKKKKDELKKEEDEPESVEEDEDFVTENPDETEGPRRKPFFFLDQIIA